MYKTIWNMKTMRGLQVYIDTVKKYYTDIKSKTTKRVQIIIGIIILILVLTNPSNTEYSDFLKVNRYQIDKYYGEEYYDEYGDLKHSYIPTFGRKRNYLIFSTFQYHDGKSTIKHHIGILSNFYTNRIYY